MRAQRVRKLGIAVAILVIATLATPGIVASETLRPYRSPKPEAGDTWQSQPGWPEISYSISGVTLDPPTVQGDYRVYTGHLQPGGTFRVSGSAKFHPSGGGTFPLLMTVDVNVDGKTDKFSWGRTDVKEPNDFSQSFDVSVPIPAHPVSGGFAININWGDWVFDGDGVSGTLTGPPPLCDEAVSFFGMDAKKVADTPSGMLVSYDDLSAGFDSAVAAYKKAHGENSITFSPGTSALLAGEWLFGYGGGSAGNVAAVRKEFSFTDEKDANLNIDIINSTTYGDDGSLPDLYTGRYHPPAGTEASLIQDMVKASNSAARKLTPGEVLGLALGEAGGDGRKAFLLAHNALRGLARGDLGDQAVFGIGTDLKFFDKYLQPMSGGGDDSGVWYHLFGTGFYHLQTYGKDSSGAAATAADVVTTAAYPLVFGGTLAARLFTKYPNRIMSVLDTVRAFDDRSGLSQLGADLGETPYDRFAYTSEQAFRENPIFGRRTPDPAKFCYNAFGIKLATAFHNGFPKYRPVPEWAGSTSAGAPPPISDGTVHLFRSFVDPTWERDGETLTMDHKTGALIGDLVLDVIPFYEQSNQAYGAIWVDSSAAPVNVTFNATDTGTLHIDSVDPANQLTAYTVPVSAGDSLTYATPEGAKQPVLAGKDGKAIEPAQANLNSDTTIRVIVFVAVLGFAVAIVVLAWRRSRRRTSPTTSVTSRRN
jgi:hypothetical protein